MKTTAARRHTHAGQLAGVVLSIIVLGVLASAFAVDYVGQERYVYSWDWAGYWVMYIDTALSLAHEPIGALRAVIRSIRGSDYNVWPVLPLLPLEWVFGPSRLPYVLGVADLYLMPAAFLLALLAWRIHRPAQSASMPLALILATASIAVLHPMWIPVLRGMPDVLGICVAALVLLLHFSRPLADQAPARLVTTGLLLCLLVLTRRWYMYWAVAFFPALAVAQAVGADPGKGAAWKAYAGAIRNGVMIGLVFVLAFLVVATPMAIRIARTDYSDIYSAYRFSASMADAAGRLVSHFGWGVLVLAAAGLAWLHFRKGHARTLGAFLLVQSAVIFVLFARTQDFGIQHYYLLMPAIGVGIATVILAVWTGVGSRFWTVAALVLVFAVLLWGAVAAFRPGSATDTTALSSIAPQTRHPPLVRHDLLEMERLLDSLEQLEMDRPGNVYVVASSWVLNSSILSVGCRFGPKPRSFCHRIFQTNNVDKRDGFPHQFVEASYVILAIPTQYHLRPEDQRVVGVLAKNLAEEGSDLGKSFERLRHGFKLDHGVTAYVYVKSHPLSESDLDVLRIEIAEHYPQRREIFVRPTP